LELAKIRVLNGEDEFLKKQNDLKSIYLYPSKDISDIEYILIGGEPHTKFKLKNYGEFNVFGIGYHIAIDASLSILAALELGVDIDSIRKNLLKYKGIKKRFDIIQKNGMVVIDDYGHHPTEIKATLKSIKEYVKLFGLEKIYAIWQPHKYSRTLDNLHGFVECFEGVDELTILPIWAAGEVKVDIDLKGAFSRYSPVMAQSVTKKDGKVLVKNRKDEVIRRYKDGLVVAFGAGDITYQIRGIL
jgi:UDP-N-acetylmuramate--alanine ligase